MDHELQLAINVIENHPVQAVQIAKIGLQSAASTIASVLRFRSQARFERDALKIVRRCEELVEEMYFSASAKNDIGLWDAVRAEQESREPSTQTFISEAVGIASDSRSEAKRRLAGRLIAQRLQIADAEEDDTNFHAALTTLGRLGERSILAIATIAAVNGLGTPERKIADLDDAEAWLAMRYGAIVRYLACGPIECDNDDFELLTHLGVIASPAPITGAFLDTPHADAADQWLAQRNLSRQVLLRNDAGSAAYIKEMRARFPTTTMLTALACGNGYLSDRHGTSYRPDEMRLSPMGRILADEVVETLSRTL